MPSLSRNNTEVLQTIVDRIYSQGYNPEPNDIPHIKACFEKNPAETAMLLMRLTPEQLSNPAAIKDAKRQLQLKLHPDKTLKLTGWMMDLAMKICSQIETAPSLEPLPQENPRPELPVERRKPCLPEVTLASVEDDFKRMTKPEQINSYFEKGFPICIKGKHTLINLIAQLNENENANRETLERITPLFQAFVRNFAPYIQDVCPKQDYFALLQEHYSERRLFILETTVHYFLDIYKTVPDIYSVLQRLSSDYAHRLQYVLKIKKEFGLLLAQSLETEAFQGNIVNLVHIFGLESFEILLHDIRERLELSLTPVNTVWLLTLIADQRSMYSSDGESIDSRSITRFRATKDRLLNSLIQSLAPKLINFFNQLVLKRTAPTYVSTSTLVVKNETNSPLVLMSNSPQKMLPEEVRKTAILGREDERLIKSGSLVNNNFFNPIVRQPKFFSTVIHTSLRGCEAPIRETLLERILKALPSLIDICAADKDLFDLTKLAVQFDPVKEDDPSTLMLRTKLFLYAINHHLLVADKLANKWLFKVEKSSLVKQISFIMLDKEKALTEMDKIRKILEETDKFDTKDEKNPDAKLIRFIQSDSLAIIQNYERLNRVVDKCELVLSSKA